MIECLRLWGCNFLTLTFRCYFRIGERDPKRSLYLLSNLRGSCLVVARPGWIGMLKDFKLMLAGVVDSDAMSMSL